MSSPTPLQSFLGGLGLPLPVHALLLLNGNVFGISGFLHRGIRGEKEGLVAVSGLLLGGAFVGLLEGSGPGAFSVGLPQVLLSGLLVGLGSKMSNGCTSGHMIAGVSRFSPRSIIATATFFLTGVITARLLHNNLPKTTSIDWTLGSSGKALLAFQGIPLILSTALYFMNPSPQISSKQDSTPTQPHSYPRLLAFLVTGFEFALSLRLSNLSDPARVLSFLLLPSHRAFDPSLAYLAAGAIPFAIILYHFARGSEKPRLGGGWAISNNRQIDAKLVSGAALFGIGWGMSGLCPGPGFVNLGRAITGGGSGIAQVGGWLASAALGGLLV